MNYSILQSGNLQILISIFTFLGKRNNHNRQAKGLVRILILMLHIKN